MKIKLNELCNECRLNAINEGFRCGCAWRDIDNKYCPFYEFLKFKIWNEEQEILITSHNVYYVRKYIILKRVNRMYQSNCYQF